MKEIKVRGIPDTVHSTLKKLAEREDRPLEWYCRKVLTDAAQGTRAKASATK